MGHNESRRGLFGLGAAAVAFGAAALMSTVTAPASRADDFTELAHDVQNLFAAGQSDFTTALSDLNSGLGVPDGLWAYYTGVENEHVFAPYQVLLGSVEALQNQTITELSPLGLGGTPATFAEALVFAENSISEGEFLLNTGATDLAMGDFTDALQFDFAGFFDTFNYPLQLLVVGAADTLLGI